MKKETKTCPYCGEEILAIAKKCKHCGEWLDTETSDVEESNELESANEWVEQSDETEGLSTREIICRVLYWAFGILAVLDLALAYLCNIDITGFKYSPLLFVAISYLFKFFGGYNNEEDE